MRLVSVTLKNFRCYKDTISIKIGDITALIGKNDAGKSTVLDALDVFFDNAKLDAGDANKDGDKRDVRIICEFDNLPQAIVLDRRSSTSLQDEYLLNEQGNLELIKIYDGSLKTPRLEGVYARAVHPTNESVQDLAALKNDDLKNRAETLGVTLSAIDQRVNAQLRRAIWESVPELNCEPREVRLDDAEAKKIWDQLKKELPAFSLFKSDRQSTDQDAEAQDPMKAAIEEALKSQEDQLAAITHKVQEEVEATARRTVEKIREMDPKLASELRPKFNPPSWKSAFKVSLTDDDEVPINKRGSGVRRLILLNFFRAKAEEMAAAGSSPSVIYAVEEPETSQHPNNQKMLMDAFADLADEPNRQVLLTTHVPMLARALPAQSLRYIEVKDDASRVIHDSSDETLALVAKALGVLPDHDVGVFIGVEGPNDINFLRRISKMLHSDDNSLPDLYELECQGRVIFFPMGGANLALWASRTKHLNIPEFYLQDSDITQQGAASAYKAKADEVNNRPNCTVVLTCKRELENYLHGEAIKAASADVELTIDDFDDVPELVARAIHEASGSETAWDALDVENRGRKESKAKRWLNTAAAEKMTSEFLAERDPEGEVRGWLKNLAELMGE